MCFEIETWGSSLGTLLFAPCCESSCVLKEVWLWSESRNLCVQSYLAIASLSGIAYPTFKCKCFFDKNRRTFNFKSIHRLVWAPILILGNITFYKSEHLPQPVVKAEGNHYGSSMHPNALNKALVAVCYNYKIYIQIPK